MKISLIHASYKSINQSKAVRDYWLKMADKPDVIEHCLAFEFDDLETRQGYSIPQSQASGVSPDQLTKFITTSTFSGVSAVANWNASALISSGDLLLVIADDLIPEKHWDKSIFAMLEDCELSKPTILKFTDFRCSSYRDYPYGDIYLPRHPMINRAYLTENRYIFNPDFEGAGADDYLLMSGISRGIIRDFRSVKFHHSVGNVLNKFNIPSCGCPGTVSSGTKTISQVAIHREKINIMSILSKKYSKMEIFKYKISCDANLISAIRKNDNRRLGLGERIEFKNALLLLAIYIRSRKPKNFLKMVLLSKS